jgi:phage-related protein
MNNMITANEATLLAAVIAAVTSVIVTLVALRFGPNYKQQISDLNNEIKDLANTLADLLQRQSSVSELLQKRFEADAASQWQPAAKVENANHENSLILKSDQEFKLQKIVLTGPSGAVMYEFPKPAEWDTVQSTGFRIPIPNKGLIQVWNNCDGARRGFVTAAITCEVSSAGKRRQFSIPVMLRQEFYMGGGAANAWIKVSG